MFGPLFGLIGLVAAVWVIYDVATQNKRLSSTAKLIWIIAAILFSILTAIVYYFLEKKR